MIVSKKRCVLEGRQGLCLLTLTRQADGSLLYETGAAADELIFFFGGGAEVSLKAAPCRGSLRGDEIEGIALWRGSSCWTWGSGSVRAAQRRAKMAAESIKSPPRHPEYKEAAATADEKKRPSDRQDAAADGEAAGRHKPAAVETEAPETDCPYAQTADEETQPFAGVFPEASWQSVSLHGSCRYMRGQIKNDGRVVAVATAVPGVYAPAPPRWLVGFDTFLCDVKGQGWWVFLRPIATSAPSPEIGR